MMYKHREIKARLDRKTDKLISTVEFIAIKTVKIENIDLIRKVSTESNNYDCKRKGSSKALLL